MCLRYNVKYHIFSFLNIESGLMPALLSIRATVRVSRMMKLMDDPALRESIEKLVTPYLKLQGAELVELQLSGSPRRQTLRIDVDRMNGLTVDECARLSRGIADVLDTHDPIGGRYVLEVSSPGLDRPLKSDRDYERAVGRTVKVILDGGRVLIGQLTRFAGPELVLAVDGEPRVVPAHEIRRANLHFEF